MIVYLLFYEFCVYFMNYYEYKDKGFDYNK